MLYRWLNRIAWISSLAPLLGYRAERRYQSLPPLAPQDQALRLPSLSIIVPARNEAHNLRQLLPTLRAQHYPGPLEIIIVDDNSTDETAVIAAEFGANVLTLTDLPAGWLGKPHACHRGAQQANGAWLLFTDADTVHTTNSAYRAVAYAVEKRLDGLSAFLHQHTKSWLDQIALTAAFAALFAGLSHTNGLMNGQYILLKRDAYFGSGGFAAVRREPIEDLALGKRLSQFGYHVPILRGETVASAQMYSSDEQMWQEFTRLGSEMLRYAGSGSLITAAFITAAMFPLLLLPFALGKRDFVKTVLLAWLAVVIGLMPWARRFGSEATATSGPIGAMIVQAAGTRGLIGRLFGVGIRWKDRTV